MKNDNKKKFKTKVIEILLVFLALVGLIVGAALNNLLLFFILFAISFLGEAIIIAIRVNKNKNNDQNVNNTQNKEITEKKELFTSTYSHEDKIGEYYKGQSKWSIAFGISVFVALIISFFVGFFIGTPLVFVGCFGVIFVGGIFWFVISSKLANKGKDFLLKNMHELQKITTKVVFVRLVASVNVGAKNISKYSVMIEINGEKMESETLSHYSKGDIIDVYVHPKCKKFFLFANEVE